MRVLCGCAGEFLEQPDPTVTTCTGNAATGAVTTVAPTGTIHTALDALVCAYSLRTGQTYANGATSYNAGVQGLLTDLGNVPRVGYQEINTPKLTYQVNDKNQVNFLFHRLRGEAAGAMAAAASSIHGLLRRTMEAGSRELLTVAAQEEFVSPARWFEPEGV